MRELILGKKTANGSDRRRGASTNAPSSDLSGFLRPLTGAYSSSTVESSSKSSTLALIAARRGTSGRDATKRLAHRRAGNRTERQHENQCVDGKASATHDTAASCGLGPCASSMRRARALISPRHSAQRTPHAEGLHTCGRRTCVSSVAPQQRAVEEMESTSPLAELVTAIAGRLGRSPADIEPVISKVSGLVWRRTDSARASFACSFFRPF